MLKNLTASIAAAALAYWALTSAAAQTPQGQGPAPAGRGRGAPAPATRIVTFEADPATIKPGGSALLIWHIENPASPNGFNGFGTIEPGVGRVAVRGSQRVTPAATTTYTLTAGTVTKSLTVTVPGTVPVAAASGAAAGASTDIPRTPEGKPDFSGIFGWGNLLVGAGAARRRR